MRKTLLASVALATLLLLGSGAQASPYENQPGPDWRPASELQSQLTSQGWQVDRIKADDGQWEVYGRDPNGRYVEAKYDPYTLQQTNLKVKSGNLQSPGSSGQKSVDRSKGKDRNKSNKRKSS